MLQHFSSVRSPTTEHSVRKGIILSGRSPLRPALRPHRELRPAHLDIRCALEPQLCIITAFVDLLLLQLPIFCPRGIYILSSLYLPVTPRLHGLRLAKNCCFGAGPFVRADSLPERMLEIVEYLVLEARLGLDHPFNEKYFAGLHNLGAIQDGRCMVITQSLSCHGQLHSLDLSMLTPQITPTPSAGVSTSRSRA